MRVRSSSTRRGFTLIEMAMGALMLAILMSLTVQFLAWSASERRISERRQRAIHEASSIIETLASLPADQLTPETLGAAKLTDGTLHALPGGTLKVLIVDGTDGLKRLTVEVGYHDRSGEPVSPVRLITYLAKRGRQP